MLTGKPPRRGSSYVDWDAFANRTGHLTEKELWDDWYVDKGWGVAKIVRESGGPYPSHQAIINRLRFLGYTIRQRGGANNVSHKTSTKA